MPDLREAMVPTGFVPVAAGGFTLSASMNADGSFDMVVTVTGFAKNGSGVALTYPPKHYGQADLVRLFGADMLKQLGAAFVADQIASGTWPKFEDGEPVPVASEDLFPRVVPPAPQEPQA